MRTFWRYLAFQAPGWLVAGLVLLAVRAWLDLPGWLVGLGVLLWVVKDLALYPLVRSAYETGTAGATGGARLVGAAGVVVEPLDPRGYVRVHGELWRAEGTPGSPPLLRGVGVVVREARGLTLVVSPSDAPGRDRGR